MPNLKTPGLKYFVMTGAITSAAFYFLNVALELGKVITVIPIIAVTPVFAMLLSLFIFGRETLTWRTYLTIALVVPGVILVSLSAMTTTAASIGNRPLAAIGLLVLGMGLFTINDAISKWLTVIYPVSEFIFVRGSFAVLTVLIFVVFSGGLAQLRLVNVRGQIARSAAQAIGTLLLVSTLGYLTARNGHSPSLRQPDHDGGPIRTNAGRACLLATLERNPARFFWRPDHGAAGHR